MNIKEILIGAGIIVLAIFLTGVLVKTLNLDPTVSALIVLGLTYRGGFQRHQSITQNEVTQ